MRTDGQNRMDLIRRDGNDSIGHLGISRLTFNALWRLDVLSITSLRELLASGKKIDSRIMIDASQAIAEFDQMAQVNSRTY